MHVKIGSNSLMFTPGVMRHMEGLYSGKSRKNKQVAVERANKGFFRGHDAEFAKKLVSSKVAVKSDFEKGTIEFEYPGTALNKVTLIVEVEADQYLNETTVQERIGAVLIGKAGSTRPLKGAGMVVRVLRESL